MIEKEIVQETIPINRSFFRTFIALFRRPEKVVEDEQTYMSPFKYLLVTLGVVIFCEFLVGLLVEPSQNELFPWSVPERLIRMDQAFSNFSNSFDSVIFILITFPLMTALNSWFFRIPVRKNIRIFCYTLAQVGFIARMPIDDLVFILTNNGTLFQNLLSVLLFIGLFYFVFFYLRVFGRKWSVLTKAIILIIISYTFYFEVGSQVVKYGYDHIAFRSQKFFHPQPNVDHLYKRELNSLDFSNDKFVAAHQTRQTITIVVERNQTALLAKFDGQGIEQSVEKVPFSVVKLLTIGKEDLLVGYDDLTEGSENLVVRTGGKTSKHKIGKDMVIADVSLTRDQTLVIIGFDSIGGGQFPRIITLHHNGHGEFKVERDSLFSGKDGRFNSVDADDSLIYVTELTQRDLETSKVTVKAMDYRFKTQWETTIFSKETKYSPVHRFYKRDPFFNRQFIKVIRDEKQHFVYTFYTMPNNISINLILHKIDSETGEVVYTKKINSQSDRLFANDFSQTDSQLIICGAEDISVSDTPFTQGYRLGQISFIEKEDGQVSDRMLYGSKSFYSFWLFKSLIVYDDTIRVIGYHANAYFDIAIQPTTLEVIKFRR